MAIGPTIFYSSRCFPMPDHIYRFRSAEKLIGKFQELERQEIYFAPPNELNDPYDGTLDVQWHGDAVLWTNLLKHYLLCLTVDVTRALISPDDPDILRREMIPGSEENLSNLPLKEAYQQVKREFFANANAARIAEVLAERVQPIGRSELRMYLRTFHGQAVQVVLGVLKTRGLAVPELSVPDSGSFAEAAARCCEIVERINREETSGASGRPVGAVFGGATESIVYQLGLLRQLEADSALDRARGWLAVICDFPAHYVSGLESLLYSDWFTACFVEEATNAAMWGVYGDSHQGVALKFRTQDVAGQPALVLNRVTGFAGSKDADTRIIRSDVPHVLDAVRYEPQFTRVDFFQMMGRITGADARFWHYDESGRQSQTSVGAGFNTEPWRQNYWRTLRAALTAKHHDWQHEKERRIVLHDGLVDLRSSKESRKLVYRFEDLEGVVFGARTSTNHIMAIFRVVREKCRKAGRKKFDFWRAEYSAVDGRMALVPLSMLKVE